MTIVLTAIIIVLCIYYIWNYLTGKPKNSPPGIIRLPIWGSYWLLLWGNYSYPHKTVDYYIKKYKSKIISCYFGEVYTVIVNDYKSVKEVLTRKEFDGRLSDNPIFRARSFGKKLGLFFNDDYEWQQQRRFALHNLRNFGFGRRHEQLESELAEELNILLDTIKNGPINEYEKKVVDKDRIYFPDILSPICANFIWAVMANKRFPRTESGEEHESLRELCKGARIFQKSGDTSGGAIALTPWLRYFGNLFGYTGFIGGNQTLIDFVQTYIDQLDDEKLHDETQNAFIPTYLREMKKIHQNKNSNNQKIDDFDVNMYSTQQLVTICIDFMFPALSAVPAVVTNCIKFMIHYPEVMKRVQEEIDDVIGCERLPTWDDRKNLPFTEATIREVMRIETITPLSVGHRCVETTTLFNYTIPKETLLLTNLSAMHNDPIFWGDPENFRPERFLTDDNKIVKDLTLPFGLGRRVCAGETFARFIIFELFATLVQNFNFELISGQPTSLDDKYPGLIVQPTDTWIKFKIRQQ
ncbi:probable cytochrome P450 304a1 [Microplitis demolitor]|uniref:probable cytochrome P450 304a1 n=1 Tax=Microplitis demolitor TaxID=69319 RepID=UPI0004CD33F9|nr:probable cytochrome P450 304a1 [Microplitis demolitor]